MASLLLSDQGRKGLWSPSTLQRKLVRIKQSGQTACSTATRAVEFAADLLGKGGRRRPARCGENNLLIVGRKGAPAEDVDAQEVRALEQLVAARRNGRGEIPARPLFIGPAPVLRTTCCRGRGIREVP